MIRPVLPWPHPLLAERSWDVPDFSGERAKSLLAELERDMRDTVEAAGGKGMSAIQVGARWRVVYVSREVAGEPLVLCNPVVLSHSDERQHMREGCMSVPTIDVDVWRWASVRVEGRKINGDVVVVPAAGLLAQALQHEMNHLEGKTIVECCSTTKQKFLRRQLARFGGRDGKLIDYAPREGGQAPPPAGT